ncbi:MAG: glycosyltransferase family 2 protein [Candidatus Paceibacterota bacterium]
MATKIEDPRARKVYRFLEMVPGLFSWLTLLGAIFFSWWKPAWASYFIITFVLYWLFRTLYFNIHLATSFRKMQKNLEKDWMKEIEEIGKEANYDWEEITQLVIVPMYKEPLEIVEESFEHLVNSKWPNDKMVVVLATEERAGEEAEYVGKKIKEKYGDEFLKFKVTVHPGDIPGEVAGKGSNETWAAQKAQKMIDEMEIPYEKVIMSSLDADTAVPPHYFSCVTYNYLTVENPTRNSYQPVALFTNNIWEAPPFSRVFAFSSTFWHTMNQERPKKLVTFSSHSMPFKALVDVGFKQTDVVSDDSRIFWQCLFEYDGDYKVKPIYYPVKMDANVASSLWETAVNIYKQQRRWAYGVGEVPYFLYGFTKNKKIPLMRKIRLGFELIESHWSWATSSLIIFMLGWLPLVLGGPEFNQTVLSYSLPRLTSRILTVAMIGLVGSAFTALILLPPRPPDYGRYKYFFMALEWVLLPILMIFFTALPALDAQTRWMFGKYMGFWPTKKVRKN